MTARMRGNMTVKVLFFYHKRRNEMSYKLVIAENGHHDSG